MRELLLAEVDARRAKVTWIALERGGWKAIVSGVELEPRSGIAADGWSALGSVLNATTEAGDAR